MLNNLPAQVSSFIGREAQLAEVRRLVGGSRLVTLTGAGGAGKTRLGLRVAAGLIDGDGDGVWFVDLAPLADSDLVAVTVAEVLGVRQEPGRSVLDTLVEAVDGRSLLVLLDNCEHVIDACAKLADALLRSCPNLALLATSREPLGIDGERVYRVPSMGTPAEDDDAEAIRASEAVRLLEDRAAAQGAPLAWDEAAAAIAGRICRRLDGIPLAVELAAARLRVMPAAELDARLDERFCLLTGGSRTALPRQQTLQAMTDWSWELLTGAERVVLARLSVFAGGFGLAAAEAVAVDEGGPAADVLGHLGALVDKSLVQFDDTFTGPGRYRLLETVRQYAAGQLDALGPAAAAGARIAHRDYYQALAEAAAPQLVSADQAAWLDRLDAELGNLRAAITFSLSQADLEPGLRLTASLREFWQARGHAAEGAGVLRAFLDAPVAQGATLPRARALAAAARLLEKTDGYAIAGDYCEEALAIARAAGDEHLVAEALYERAWVLLRQGQPGAALPLIEPGLDLARRLGEPHLTARLLSARVYATYIDGDAADAAADAAEALRLFRQAGDWLQGAATLGNLGYIELSAGDLDAARRHLAEALDIARARGDRDGIVYGTLNLGFAEYLGGSPDAAEPLFAESLDLASRIGMKRQIAYPLLGLALTGRDGADPGWSARLHGAADQALADMGETIEPLEGNLADLDRQRLRVTMGAEAFEAEYAAGRALDLIRVAQEALRGTRTMGAAQPAGARGSEPDAARAAAGSAEGVTVLTPRELDVLKLVAQGLSNQDIAQRLVLSEHTVHRHLANILRKLNLSSRAAAAAWGVRTGLVLAWPDRAIRRGRAKLARTGEAKRRQRPYNWCVSRPNGGPLTPPASQVFINGARPVNMLLERAQVDPGWIHPDILAIAQNFRRAQIDPGIVTTVQLDPGFLRGAQLDPGYVRGAQVDPGSKSSAQVDPGYHRNGQIDPGTRTGAQVDPGTKTSVQIDPGVKANQIDPGINRGQVDPGFTYRAQVDPGDKARGQVDPGGKTRAQLDPGTKAGAQIDPGNKMAAQIDPGSKRAELRIR